MKIRYDSVSVRAARLEKKLSKKPQVLRKPTRREMSYWVPWLPGIDNENKQRTGN